MDPTNQDRRRFFGTAAMAVAAAQLGLTASRRSTTSGDKNAGDQAGNKYSFAPLKQIDAGVLNVGYAEAGPANGPPVILLHGWPYDIYSFVDVTPAAGLGRLSRDRAVSARLWRDALSFQRHGPQRPAVGDRASTSSPSWMP